jgi:hypothetical protein
VSLAEQKEKRSDKGKKTKVVSFKKGREESCWLCDVMWKMLPVATLCCMKNAQRVSVSRKEEKNMAMRSAVNIAR